MKKGIIFIVLIIIIVFIYFFLISSRLRSDVILNNYNVNPNGQSLILEVSVSNSSGYIRKMEHKKVGKKYYLFFYSTFGINSKLGSKNVFELEISDDVNEIYFCSGKNEYNLVLKKDNVTSQWGLASSSVN